MAVQTTKGKIPEGAIKLSKPDAINFQWQQIDKWPNWTDVWSFKIGIPALVGLGAITSLRINSVIRSKLYLQEFGKVISFYTAGLTAALVTGGAHYTFISNEMMSFKPFCPVCIESRAIAIQLSGCIVYPSIVNMIANCVLANKYGTYRVPYFADGRGIVKFYLKLAGQLKNKLWKYAVVNAIAAGFITYSESKSLVTIRTKLLEGEVSLNQPYSGLPK